MLVGSAAGVESACAVDEVELHSGFSEDERGAVKRAETASGGRVVGAAGVRALE